MTLKSMNDKATSENDTSTCILPVLSANGFGSLKLVVNDVSQKGYGWMPRSTISAIVQHTGFFKLT